MGQAFPSQKFRGETTEKAFRPWSNIAFSKAQSFGTKKGGSSGETQ